MTINWDFSNRTVLITGAAQGIGAALTRFFHSAGAKVVAVDLDTKKLLERMAQAQASSSSRLTSATPDR
jgi:3-oxoacyl-[acyl-carrier protein] reductase